MPPPASRSPHGASSLLWVWCEHGGGTLGAATPERMRPQGEASPRRRRTLPKDPAFSHDRTLAPTKHRHLVSLRQLCCSRTHIRSVSLSVSTSPFGSRDGQAGLTVASGAGTKEGSRA